jgi:hypothetical protein
MSFLGTTCFHAICRSSQAFQLPSLVVEAIDWFLINGDVSELFLSAAGLFPVLGSAILESFSTRGVQNIIT